MYSLSSSVREADAMGELVPGVQVRTIAVHLAAVTQSELAATSAYLLCLIIFD